MRIPDDERLENRLAALQPVEPSPALRGRVLRHAEREARVRHRTDIVFRLAVCALTVTLGWAHWKENDTAERMACAAANTSEFRPPKLEPGSETSLLARIVLNPRLPMPLRPGVADTRMHIRPTSIALDSSGEGASG